MGRKNVRITEEAYQRLAAFKGPRDSFSDVVIRLCGGPSIIRRTKRVDLTQFAGILTKE